VPVSRFGYTPAVQKSSLQQIFKRAALAIAIFSASVTTADGFDTEELLRVGQIADTTLLAAEIERAHPLKVFRLSPSIPVAELRRTDFSDDEWKAVQLVKAGNILSGIFQGDCRGGFIVVRQNENERSALLHEFTHFLIAKAENRKNEIELFPGSPDLWLRYAVAEEMAVDCFALQHRKALLLKPKEVIEIVASVRFIPSLYLGGNAYNLESEFSTRQALADFRKSKKALLAEFNLKASEFLRADPELRKIDQKQLWSHWRLRSLCLFLGGTTTMTFARLSEFLLSQSTIFQDLGWGFTFLSAAALSFPPRHDSLRFPIPVFQLAFQGATRAAVVAGCVKLLESLSANLF
jgi:hypothetical protein